MRWPITGDEDALEFLDKAVESCPTYAYWQQLGEVAVESAENADRERAAEAFAKAYELADDVPQQVTSLTAYANVLFASGDPQRALEYIQEARKLQPQNEQVNAAYDVIYARASKLEEEDVLRGLGDLAFEPLIMREPQVSASPSSGGSGSVTPAVATPPVGAPLPAQTKDLRRVQIPINFQTGSTELDPSTRGNLQVLANALARLDGQQFTFVGHADLRGEENANMNLSWQRAIAMSREVVRLQPSLEGRIDARGDGENSPLRTDNTEEAHAENRRLEIFAR